MSTSDSSDIRRTERERAYLREEEIKKGIEKTRSAPSVGKEFKKFLDPDATVDEEVESGSSLHDSLFASVVKKSKSQTQDHSSFSEDSSEDAEVVSPFSLYKNVNQKKASVQNTLDQSTKEAPIEMKKATVNPARRSTTTGSEKRALASSEQKNPVYVNPRKIPDDSADKETDTTLDPAKRRPVGNDRRTVVTSEKNPISNAEKRPVLTSSSKPRSLDKESSTSSLASSDKTVTPKDKSLVGEDDEESGPPSEETPEPKAVLPEALPQKEVKERPFGAETMSSIETTATFAKDTKNKSQSKATTRFTQEQQDLGYINTGMSSFNTVEPMKEDKEGASSGMSKNIKEIVDQIVKEIYTLEHGGKSETTIILQRPPMLSQAHVVITSFDSATKELNISFQNLTQAGKKLLDDNMDGLKKSLETNGLVTHMIVTTTILEPKAFLQEPSKGRRREEDKGDKSGQSQEESDEESI